MSVTVGESAVMSGDSDDYADQQPWVTFFSNVFGAAVQAGAPAIVLVLASFFPPLGEWLSGPVVAVVILVLLFVRLRLLLQRTNDAPDDGWRLAGIDATLVAGITTAGAGLGMLVGQWMGGPATRRIGTQTWMGPKAYMPLLLLAAAAYLGARLSRRLRRTPR